MEKVILVDKNDQMLGLMEKQEAHVKGLLHRAFSIFIFNKDNKLLIQKRAFHKYHSGGLWTNTCCSHPRENETTIEAAHRRLNEEMGMKCKLELKFNFIYKAQLDNNLYEHEFDHVFFGFSNDLPKINKQEVDSYKYESLNFLKEDIILSPNKYTEWFKICFQEVDKNFISK